MAIQIRRGTESGWQNNSGDVVVGEPVITTDTERFFVGTGTGTFAEYVNISVLAPAYDTTRDWYEGEYCVYMGGLYVCTADTTGAFDSNDWSATDINGIVASLSQSRSVQLNINREAPSLDREEIRLEPEIPERIEREPVEDEPIDEPGEEAAEETEEEEPVEDEPTEDEVR